MTQTEDKTIETLAISSSGLSYLELDQDTGHAEGDGLANLKANPYVSLEDQALQALICRVVNQDQAAFTALFKAMVAHVYSLALRITGNAQLAEEVSEDTFFQIWRQAPSFDPARGTAKSWILTIARSRALDARRNIPPFESQAEPETELSNLAQSCGDISDLLSAVEQNQLLHSALQSLEPLPRQLIALSFFKGLSHEEIAIHAELPLGTVKSHLRRAVIHLREILPTINNITVMKL